MELTNEQKALFGADPGDDWLTQESAAVTKAPAPAVQSQTPTPSLLAQVIPPDAPTNSATVPPPAKAAKKLEIMPACAECGTDLNPDNASKKRGGGWKHIGCQGVTDPAPMVAAPPGPLFAAAAKMPGSILVSPTPLKPAVQTTDYEPGSIRAHTPPGPVLIEFGPEAKLFLERLIRALEASSAG